MFNNLNTQANTVNEPGNGVFNQFVAPIASDEFTPKKDNIKIFLSITLMLVILIGIGSFFYLKTLSDKVKEREAKILTYDKSSTLVQFESQLPEMRILSKRLKLLNTVFDSRVYVSQMLFPILESSTESSSDSYVYFNKFSLKKQINSTLVSLNISGLALDYPTLYRQINNFKSGLYSQYIKNFKLSGFSLNEMGTIEFDISFDMDISTNTFLNYLNTLNPNFENGNTNNSAIPSPLYGMIPKPKTESASSTEENLEDQLLKNNSSSSNVNNNNETSSSSLNNDVKNIPVIITHN